MLFFVIVILAFTLEILLIGRKSRAAAQAVLGRLSAFVPERSLPIVLGALVVAFSLEQAIVAHAAHAALKDLPWSTQLPIALTDPGCSNCRGTGDAVRARASSEFIPLVDKIAFAAISVLEALLLGALLIAAHNWRWRRPDTVASVLAALAIIGLAILAPAIASSDMYAYVGDALLGPGRAYSPPPTALPADYQIINRLWAQPLPAAYGPLWISANSAVLKLVSGLGAQLVLLRLVNVAMLAVSVGALRLLRVPPGLIAATAVNPAIAFYYIANGHNDLVPIALVLVAMTFAARFPVPAAILAGLGASIKVSLVVPASAAALVIASLSRRLLYIAVMLATSAAIAVVLGGKAYFHALSVVAGVFDMNTSARIRIPHAIVALGAVVLTAFAVLKERTFKSGAFGFAALTLAFFPWYTIWGLPYACARNDVLATLLIGLPLATAVLDEDLRLTVTAPLIILALLIAIVMTLMQRRLPAARTAAPI